MGLFSAARRKADMSSVRGVPVLRCAGEISACNHSRRPLVGETQKEEMQPALVGGRVSGSKGGRNSSSSMVCGGGLAGAGDGRERVLG